jgi:type II secretory ATPase GspE/PulE/Tfp pilus assembly ATPase PilB-like protein
VNSQDILSELINEETSKEDVNITEEKAENPEIKDEKNLSTQDLLSNVINEEIKNEGKSDDDKIIFDINIKSVDDLIDILLKNEYDFLVVEPQEDYVRISFKKDSILKLKKYVKFPTYSALLVNLKKLSNLEVDKIDQEQK